MKELEAKIIVPLEETGTKFKMIVIGFLVLIGAMFYAWFFQIDQGLSVTGLSQPTPWGIYIINFIFFISISIAGTLISGILRLLKQDWANPITRIAEIVTIVAVIIAFLNILFDIGRPQRLFNMFFYGQATSPFVWDLTWHVSPGRSRRGGSYTGSCPTVTPGPRPRRRNSTR